MMTSHGAGKLKVLYIVSIMPPSPGGAATDYASFVKGVSQKRFAGCVESVTVLTEKGCFKDYGNRVKIKDSLRSYDTAAEKSFIAQLANYITIIFYILFGGYDVVHIHARYVYARYIGRLVWLALVLSRARALIDLRDRFYGGFGSGAQFIVCSEALKSYYSWVKRASYVPVPLSLPPVDRDIEPGENLAYFGAIARNKGVIKLIEGFAGYRASQGGFKELHIYGANNMGGEFLSAIEGRAGVRYMGCIESNQVAGKIMEYGAVVLPSKSEGMPRICLETIYCGRPIICHRNIKSILPCVPDEFVLEELTAEEFARVFANAEKVKGPVEYGYDFTVHSPQSVCELLVRHYEEIVSYQKSEVSEGKAHHINRRG